MTQSPSHCDHDHDHHTPGHVCNHAPSSLAENLDEIEFSHSIHAACIANNVTRVKSILAKNSRGPSPGEALDSAGYTALHYASRAGNKDICTLLLNAGADVDSRTPELGATPLMRAVQQNHLDVARLLLSYGATLDERNADQENIFHLLAGATRQWSESGGGKEEQVLEMARFLLLKAASRKESMLAMEDIRGNRPVDCLGDGGEGSSSLEGLRSLLSPQS